MSAQVPTGAGAAVAGGAQAEGSVCEAIAAARELDPLLVPGSVGIARAHLEAAAAALFLKPLAQAAANLLALAVRPPARKASTLAPTTPRCSIKIIKII